MEYELFTEDMDAQFLAVNKLVPIMGKKKAWSFPGAENRCLFLENIHVSLQVSFEVAAKLTLGRINI